VNEKRHILHLDADAFFASVEQAADPRLRGRPVAVGGAKRGVVASASYEARQQGVRTTMPTAHARRICPSLVVVAGDFEKYERFSRFVFSYAYDFTPSVEIASIDEGYADLSGLRRGSPRQVAERIRAVVRQSLRITLSEGVGANKLVAAIGSKLRKPDSLLEVPRGTERTFLAPLDIGWLPGIGPKLANSLRRAGLQTINHLTQVTPEQLALFTGHTATTLCEMAQGIDPRPVVPDPPRAKSFSEQETFEQDSTDEDFVRARLRSMADRLMAKVRADRRTARTIEVRLRYNDFDDVRRSESLVEPTDLETVIYPVIDRLIRRAWERRVSIRLVGLKLGNLYGAEFQDTLGLADTAKKLAEESPRWRTGATRSRRRALAGVVDRLREQFGPQAILRSHDFYLTRPPTRHYTSDTGYKSRTNSRKEQRSLGSTLNIKSSYSFLDSLLSPELAAQLAATEDIPVVALTDPNLHGTVELSLAAAKAGIRAILAAEVRIATGEGALAYVKDRTGYETLCQALSGKAVLTGEEAGLLFAPTSAFPEVRYHSPSEHPMFHILQSIRTLTLADLRTQHRRHGHWHFDPSRPTNTQLAQQIIEECQFSLNTGGLNFPEFKPPDRSPPSEFLRTLAYQGLQQRYGSQANRYRPQLEEELLMISRVGYEEYFLVVWDLLQDCRQAGHEWITRGSAADSLVCYCLGISDVCPIRFELYFKRFLNPDRMALNKLPDIDIDFAHDRKDAVFEMIFRKYGRHAAVVGGFSTYRGRSAFADIAKVFGVSEFQIRRYTRHLPHTSANRLRDVLKQSRECRDLDFGENPFSTALDLAERLDSFPRHPKMHPCGVVLARQPITSLCPVFDSPKGYPTTHFDMDSVEAIGLVKMDILAQGGLAVLRDANSSLAPQALPPSISHPSRRTKPYSLSKHNESYSDPAVWKMIASGGARGVHHIESPAMTSLVRMVNANNIDDLIAIVSVIRPGAANTMRKVSFARRAQGLESTEYAHPSLEPVLRSTYGVVAYEEHILQICETFADMPAGRADLIRRALVKGRRKEAETFFDEFATAARSRERQESEIQSVWALIIGFNGYAFCRAHSTAYGVEAYQAACLKRYHPAEFLAAVLTHGKGFYDRLTYSIECRQLGLSFTYPTINQPVDSYRAEGKVIHIPLSQIKHLSMAMLDRTRKQAPFDSLEDFVYRVRPAGDELDSLIRAGALDTFAATREQLSWEARAISRRQESSPLFQWAQIERPLPKPPGKANQLQTLRDEMELFGFTVTDHPIALFPDLAWDTYCPIRHLMRYPHKIVTIAGMIIATRSHRQADGRPMKFISLCDPTGIVECELFATTYARFGAETVRHPVVEVSARVTPFDNHNGCTLNVHRVRACRTTYSK